MFVSFLKRYRQSNTPKTGFHIDGTEDEEIHCKVDTRDAHVVRRDTASLVTGNRIDTEDSDPFADTEEDEDELEENEAL